MLDLILFSLKGINSSTKQNKPESGPKKRKDIHENIIEYTETRNQKRTKQPNGTMEKKVKGRLVR